MGYRSGYWNVRLELVLGEAGDLGEMERPS